MNVALGSGLSKLKPAVVTLFVGAGPLAMCACGGVVSSVAVAVAIALALPTGSIALTLSVYTPSASGPPELNRPSHVTDCAPPVCAWFDRSVCTSALFEFRTCAVTLAVESVY